MRGRGFCRWPALLGLFQLASAKPKNRHADQHKHCGIRLWNGKRRRSPHGCGWSNSTGSDILGEVLLWQGLSHKRIAAPKFHDKRRRRRGRCRCQRGIQALTRRIGLVGVNYGLTDIFAYGTRVIINCQVSACRRVPDPCYRVGGWCRVSDHPVQIRIFGESGRCP